MAEASGLAAHLWPSAEQQLLLDAALRDGAPSLAAFRTWSEQVDMTADFGPETIRLLPLVYENMRRQGVHDPQMGRLKGVYRRAWYETHRLFHAAQPVVAALCDAGIEVMLLKGTPLALTYYDNAALRPMADVDVMVARADLDCALGILAAGGWHPTVEIDADVLGYRHAMQFIGLDGAEIDLHWHVLNEAASDDVDQAFRRRAEPVDFLGSPVRQIDPTDLLFMVVVHGVRWNHETPIRWIPDALTILRQRGAEIDWTRMAAFAVAQRLTHRLGIGLSYLVSTFAAPVPPDILASLVGRRRSLLERVEQTVLLADNHRLERTALGTQWLWFVEYCRFANRSNPLALANGYSRYVRSRMGLSGRRDFLPIIVRGVARRMGWRPSRAARKETP